MSADLPLVLKALAFAADKHRDQRRKDAAASPYINHPIALANVLVREGEVTDADVLAAALLHDTVEDTQTTPAELRAAFGPAIAAIVEEVTDDKSLPKAERKRLQVEHAAKMSAQAKLVKLADKICNLRDMADQPPSDREVAGQQDFVCERGPGNDGDRSERQALIHVRPSAEQSAPAGPGAL